MRPFLPCLVLAGLACAAASPPVRAAEPSFPARVERWGVFELALAGPAEGNPFVDVRLTATFTHRQRTVDVEGFYDGGGVYRVRFMPEETGTWTFETRSNRWTLTNRTGTFTATAPAAGNHGPVRVHATYHFAHADGTPFRQLGTTSYTWTHRPEEIQEQTLRTLAASPFNKLRMCVFPQSHGIRHMPPTRWPFAGQPGSFDFTRFNPEFFQHLEGRIGQLRDLGIECDLILFHPYGMRENWGFDTLDAATDERYLRYVVARLAAFRNVWWSIANEYDLMPTKTEADWDRFFQIVRDADPYGHLRSIHNCWRLYNHSHPWVTHASIQNGSAVEDAGRAEQFRAVWRKPVVFDEAKYEGDFEQYWGRLSGPEMVHRFWAGTVGGTYVGHSEFFVEPREVVWLGQGGVLRGESPRRLAFLREVLADAPADGIDPIEPWRDPYGSFDYALPAGEADFHAGGKPGEYYLVYFGRARPTRWTFQVHNAGVAEGMKFRVEVIDAWNMTITPAAQEFVLKKKDAYTLVDAAGGSVDLPGLPYVALRIRRVP